MLGFTTVGNDDTPITVVVNYRTKQYWHHVGYPIELADGFVALQVSAEAGDPNTDDVAGCLELPHRHPSPGCPTATGVR